MSRPLPAWVKAKGFSNWGDYMASIRPNPRHRRQKVSSISNKKFHSIISKFSPGTYGYERWMMQPAFRKKVREQKNPVEMRPRIQVSKRSRSGRIGKRSPLKGFKINRRRKKPEFCPECSAPFDAIHKSSSCPYGKIKRRRNPIAVYNPRSSGEIKVLPMKNVEIRYQRSSGNFHGEWFKHLFKESVEILGRTDGSILIRSVSGKKLWGSLD